MPNEFNLSATYGLTIVLLSAMAGIFFGLGFQYFKICLGGGILFTLLDIFFICEYVVLLNKRT